MARTSYNAGPCAVVIGTPGSSAVTLYSKDDVIIDEIVDSEDIQTSAYGKVGEIVLDRIFQLNFTPIALMLQDILAVLHPYAAKKVGDEIYPQTDSPIVLVGMDGTQRSYAASAVTKLCSLGLGMKKEPFGATQFTCLGAGNTDWVTAASMVTATTGVDFNANTRDLDVTKVIKNWYKGNWPATGASAPWADFSTVEGFDLDFNLGLQDKPNDRYGLANKMITGLDVTCKFSPCGIVESDIASKFKYQGAGAARGQSLSTLGSANDLKIEGGATPTKLTATVMGAAIKAVKMAFSLKTPRLSEITMVNTLNTYGGTIAGTYTVAIS